MLVFFLRKIGFRAFDEKSGRVLVCGEIPEGSGLCARFGVGVRGERTLMGRFELFSPFPLTFPSDCDILLSDGREARLVSDVVVKVSALFDA